MAVIATAPTREAINSQRLRVGELVTLTPDYEAPGNNGSYNLKPEEIGLIVRDDFSINPF